MKYNWWDLDGNKLRVFDKDDNLIKTFYMSDRIEEFLEVNGFEYDGGND